MGHRRQRFSIFLLLKHSPELLLAGVFHEVHDIHLALELAQMMLVWLISYASQDIVIFALAMQVSHVVVGVDRVRSVEQNQLFWVNENALLAL